MNAFNGGPHIDPANGNTARAKSSKCHQKALKGKT